MKDLLIGKKLMYRLVPELHRGACGQYTGKIVKVFRLKRGNKIKSITVQRPSFDSNGPNWKGIKIKLKPADWTCEGCGVLYYKKVIPVNEFKKES